MLNIYYYKGFNLLKTHYKKFFIAPSARLLQTNLISEIKIFYKKNQFECIIYCSHFKVKTFIYKTRKTNHAPRIDYKDFPK